MKSMDATYCSILTRCRLWEQIPVAVKGVDMISVSGRQIHGPKGTGALYIRKGLSIPAFMVGGGQERNMRSGTENTAGIAGFGKAADISAENFSDRTICHDICPRPTSLRSQGRDKRYSGK